MRFVSAISVAVKRGGGCRSLLWKMFFSTRQSFFPRGQIYAVVPFASETVTWSTSNPNRQRRSARPYPQILQPHSLPLKGTKTHVPKRTTTYRNQPYITTASPTPYRALTVWQAAAPRTNGGAAGAAATARSGRASRASQGGAGGADEPAAWAVDTDEEDSDRSVGWEEVELPERNEDIDPEVRVLWSA